MMKNFQKILNSHAVAKQEPRPKSREDERGNVLIYILIAVVLFAALSYTVSTMMRGGNVDMIGEENASLYAGEIMDYGRVMRQAVQNVRISNGCEDTQISFTRVSGDTYEHTSENPRCQVFNINGGNINYQAPSNLVTASDWIFTGSNSADGIGTAAPDLIAILPNITQSVCDSINDRSGITATGSDADISFTPFTGSYASTETLDAADARTSGCLNHVDSGDNLFFYQVLIAR